MSVTQPQLLDMALVPGDIVYTPDWIARDMVNYFKPAGRILEPSAGDGAFLKYLPPQTEWCEIEKGRDFFKWQEPVDWLFGNPPYSVNVFRRWIEHSFALAANVVYLLPTNKIFQSWQIMDMVQRYGAIKAILAYGGGSGLGFPNGFPMGAFHLRRGWKGDTTISYSYRKVAA